MDGDALGGFNGDIEGTLLGLMEGRGVAPVTVGDKLGGVVGDEDGLSVEGEAKGDMVGDEVGEEEGFLEGDFDGDLVGGDTGWQVLEPPEPEQVPQHTFEQTGVEGSHPNN